MNTFENITQRPLRKENLELSSLACYAAVEIDNLSRSQETSSEALHKLYEVLADSMPSGKGQSRMKALYDYNAPFVMYHAMLDLGEKPPTVVSDVLKVAAKVVERFHTVVSNPLANQQELVPMRTFCLALAKYARAAESLSVPNGSNHPYRK